MPDARPGLAAAERADAAFDAQRCPARHRDAARIGAAVIGVVDLAGPFAGAVGCMPENSGSPIIGRVCSAGLGFLSSTCGLPVEGSIGSRSQTMTPQIPPPHLLTRDAGIAGLRQPDADRLHALRPAQVPRRATSP